MQLKIKLKNVKPASKQRLRKANQSMQSMFTFLKTKKQTLLSSISIRSIIHIVLLDYILPAALQQPDQHQYQVLQ